VLIGDELLKSFVRARLALCTLGPASHCASIHVIGPLWLIDTRNAGSALGFAQGLGAWVLLAALGLLLIPLYLRRLRGFGLLAAVAAGLQLGGAAGNLIDRIVLGGATDMLTFGSQLVWNLADIALMAGSLLATALLLRSVWSTPPKPMTSPAHTAARAVVSPR
jgi:signal peptidase II